MEYFWQIFALNVFVFFVGMAVGRAQTMATLAMQQHQAQSNLSPNMFDPRMLAAMQRSQTPPGNGPA